MSILLLDVEQIQLDVAFWAQKYLRSTVVALADSILPHLQQETCHRFGNVHQVPFTELMAGVFFLGDCFFQGEVVVVGVGMQNVVLDAELDVWMRGGVPSVT